MVQIRCQRDFGQESFLGRGWKQGVGKRLYCEGPSAVLTPVDVRQLADGDPVDGLDLSILLEKGRYLLQLRAGLRVVAYLRFVQRRQCCNYLLDLRGGRLECPVRKIDALIEVERYWERSAWLLDHRNEGLS